MARALLSEEIANKIKQLIEKQYKPGDKIPTEMELAEFLGVSRTTIRESVKILCSSNILVIKRGNGTFVCENPGVPADPLGVKALDEQKVKDDLFETSKVMEPALVKLAAEKASDESIAKVKKVHQQYLDLLAGYRDGDYVAAKEFRKLDIAFHKAVIDCCDNEIISRSVPMFLTTCAGWLDVWVALDLDRVLENFEKDHTAILEALEEHDPEKAYRLALEHTEEVIEIYQSNQK